MKKNLYLIIFCVLVLVQTAFGQTQRKITESKTPTKIKETKTDYSNLKKQAEEVSGATVKGDFGKIIDYTYPKVVEALGGRDKMLAFLKQDSQQMKADGFEIASVEIGAVKQIERIENQLFALLPIKLTIKVPNGTGFSESSLIGISNDNGENWKFVSGINQEKFRDVFPKAADKIQIPAEKLPVMIEN